MIESEQEMDRWMGAANLKADYWTALRRRALARARSHRPPDGAARASVWRRRPGRSARVRAIVLDRSERASNKSIALQSVPKEFQERAADREATAAAARRRSPWNSP